MNEFSSGLVLMVIGMAVVFCFLLVMIVCSSIMSKIVEKFFPEKQEPPKPAKGGGTSNKGGEVAAITAAVHQFIRSNK